MIDTNAWRDKWRYFCLLTEQFYRTLQYVDDKRDAIGNLCNGKTFSIEYYGIIVKVSAEFENIGKLICQEICPGFNINSSNIVSISECIKKQFPHIGEVEIITPNSKLYPLRDWRITNNHVEGLQWWHDYNSIKHKRYEHYEKANLNNCMAALASLLVLELYYTKLAMKYSDKDDWQGVNIGISNIHCQYFDFFYIKDVLLPIPIDLPDQI